MADIFAQKDSQEEWSMAEDVISRLQAVKQAEAEKARRIAEAKAAAQARIAAVKAYAAAVPENVNRRLAEEEKRLQREIEENLRARLAALEQWERERSSQLRAAAACHGEIALNTLARAFLEENGAT